MHVVLEHVAGRVPVIVTTTHFSSHQCADRSRRAQAAGAAMVMIMPPYHGATIRIGERGIEEFYRTVSDAIDIPIMIQDAPVSGTPLSAPFLARMANEIEHVSYFKIEVPQAANQLREHIQQWLPLNNNENRQGDHTTNKTKKKEGSEKRTDAVRHPLPAMHPATRE